MKRTFFSFAKFGFALLGLTMLGGCNNPFSSESEAPLLKKLTVARNDITVATIYSNGDIDDELMLHAADILAGYLDNDGDGNWDNLDVATELDKRNAAILLIDDDLDIREWLQRLTAELQGELQSEIQDVWQRKEFLDLTVADITLCSTSSYQACFPAYAGSFDASYEEILHLITSIGYANVYPEIFGEVEGSAIALAMNVARNDANADLIDENYCHGDGQEKICAWPQFFIEPVWFLYTDPTCDYACMITEYTYWNITSLIGVQSYRAQSRIEWKCLQLSKFSDGNDGSNGGADGSYQCRPELETGGSVATLYGLGATVNDGVFVPGDNTYQLPTSTPFGRYEVNAQAVNWNIENF